MKKRIEYIDIYRSIGISLMTLGHMLKFCLLRKFIYAFHMPMFFFISGFLFSHKTKEELSNKDFFIKKFKSLVIPYLFFGLLGYILYSIINGFSIDPLKHLFFINDRKIVFAGPIWFLSALFFADAIFFLLDRYIKNSIVLFIVVFLISMFGCVASMVLPFHLPYSLGQAFVGLGFIYIGYFIKNNKDKFSFILNMPNIYLFLSTIIFAILILKNGRISMYGGDYFFIPLFWINATAYSIIILNYSKKFYNKFGNSKISHILCNIGLYSIIYVGLNSMIVHHLTNPFFKNLNLNTNVSICLNFIVSMTILYFISKLIMNTKLKVLVGKF